MSFKIMDLFPIERIGQGRYLMNSEEGTNGGPYASSGGRSFLGHKKGNLNHAQY